MKRIEVLAQKYKDVKRVMFLEEVIVSHMRFIKSIRGGDFMDTVEFLRESFGDQMEDFDEFFEYVIFLMLEDGCRVGNEVEPYPINTLLDGSVINYDLDNEKNAKLIVSSWKRCLEMYPIKKIGDENYSKLATLSVFLPRFIRD